jgi:hypothetical protein
MLAGDDREPSLDFGGTGWLVKKALSRNWTRLMREPWYGNGNHGHTGWWAGELLPNTLSDQVEPCPVSVFNVQTPMAHQPWGQLLPAER